MSLAEKLTIILVILDSIAFGLNIRDRIKNRPKYEGRHRKEDKK